jgi:hypothetical protein
MKEVTSARGCELDVSSTGHGLVAGYCQHSNETLTYIKDEELLHLLCNHQLLKEDSAPYSGSINYKVVRS